MEQQDRDFMRTFTMVLVGLALLGVIFFFVAQILAKLQGGGEQAMERARAAKLERIAPVGTVVTGEAAPAQAAAEGGQSGQALYDAACAACHATGVAGAPAMGDKEAWAERLEQGMDTLLGSVVNGKGAMPPRGGTQASEAELQSAIVHMLTASGLEVPGGADTASAEAPAQAPDAAAPDAAEAQAGSDLDLARGREVVQQTCSACHAAGVAGAPKIGDTEAWRPRVDKGMDQLLASTINGLGAMPPRAGGNFTDAELEAAIQVMLDDSGF